MLIGYVRVSTREQNLNLQLDALEQTGCDQVFQEQISGIRTDRPALQQALAYLRPGDTLVVWRLDCLGSSLKHLIKTVGQLEEQQISFKSLQEAIDTTTSGGHLVFQIFGALAEFERHRSREQTQAGLAAARDRGKKGGAAPESRQTESAAIISVVR